MAARETPEGFEEFKDWKAVLGFVRRNRNIYYWAPLDREPVRVSAKAVSPDEVRLTPWAARLPEDHPHRVDPFTIDASRLPYLFKRNWKTTRPA